MFEAGRKPIINTMIATLALVCLGASPGVVMATEFESGIQIHGDWVIEISSSNGKLLQRIEFKNALVPTGQQALTNVFKGEWRLDDSSPSTIILQFRGTGIDSNALPECNSSPVTQLLEGPELTFKSSTISFPAACITNDSFTIDEVLSRLAVQDVATPANVFSTPFTAKALDTPVTVLPDQQFSLQATFSFE